MATASQKSATETSKMNAAGHMLQTYFSALSTAGRSVFEGTVEVDKLVLSKLSDAVQETVEYGRDLMSVRDLNTAVSMYANFAETRLNKSVADTKEVLDLVKNRSEEVIKPFKAYA